MATPKKKDDNSYTYAEYLKWSQDERYELINGVAYNMNRGCSPDHQGYQSLLIQQIGQRLKGHECRVFGPPFDVILSRPNARVDETDTILQPDVLVICDKSKVDSRGCHGGPEFVIEITSPSTKLRDKTVKVDLYEKYKVNEYWIINPEKNAVYIRRLNSEGTFDPVEVLEAKGKIPIRTLSNLKIDFDEIQDTVWRF